MLRIFVDSGSSIKQEEKEQYGVEIFPLHITLGEKEIWTVLICPWTSSIMH